MRTITTQAGEVIAARYDLGTTLGCAGVRGPRRAGPDLAPTHRPGTLGGQGVRRARRRNGAAADVAFQLTAAAAGIPLPRPVLTPDGRVLLAGGEAGLASSTLRVYEWVDLVPGVFVDARGIKP